MRIAPSVVSSKVASSKVDASRPASTKAAAPSASVDLSVRQSRADASFVDTKNTVTGNPGKALLVTDAQQKTSHTHRDTHSQAENFRTETLGFKRVSASNADNKRFDFYADEREFDTRQRKALQAYSDTQNMGRLNSNAEYLSAVDLFV